MDISAMLSNEGGAQPATKSNGANGISQGTNSIVQSIKSETFEDGEIDNEYKSTFESNINIINDLDKSLELSNAIKILKFDEARMNSTMIQTDRIASNYIERVVAEDISTRNNKISDTNKNKDLHHLDSSKPLHHNTTRGREYKWGNSREINKIEPKPKRKKQVSTPVADDNSPQKSKRRPSFNDISEGYGDYDKKLGANGKPKRKSSPSPADSLDSPPTSKRPKRKAAAAGSLLRDDDLEYGDSKSRTRSIKRELDDEGNAITDDSKKPNSKEQKAVIKQYDNTYVAIWKDLSRKDGPKVSRLVQQSTQAKLINLKKTSILAAREAKRWQLKNNKGQKDLTTKARRAMREMFNFWKRNERIERELRKKHEKDLIDKAKREEEEREAKRQSRKLNFLITQTELYSHFIGKKIKTEEIEGKDSDPTIKAQTNTSYDKYTNVDGSTKHDINSLDFDNDDDEFFNNAAAANAQNALEAAQSKAREFDGPQDPPAKDDDKNGDEMNFQNPTLMGDLNITQPKLLKCTLKEYQIKGLNWLANLYEQGINGILADEMGLGKTVQSISVLSYLAEHHNIWGPFLVVTPASTLHNWQQEITKFVPDFKVLPYWGNGKDRKILRKFWDRKNVRYGKDAPFHVLVTSYQLVVADAAYFQKMKWQYMILDEAQAIKSSQSSRWKSLLSFSCRNRLLLTGTPIQNSMQELWALLHFIMPSLFDSHDEFSDWFSKDIESHAQSNTNLDEQQLRRLHMILKPFMLRRIKKNVQSELGDKVEIDIFCDLTNRQKKYYQMLKSQISIMDLLDSSNSNSGDDNTNLINLVMQFRKVCNHPDLFERADVNSSFSMAKFAETSSFLRESNDIEASYTTENLINFNLPKLVYDELLTPSMSNDQLSKQSIYEKFSIYDPENTKDNEQFSWVPLVNTSSGELQKLSRTNVIDRAIDRRDYNDEIYTGVSKFKYVYEDNDEEKPFIAPNKRLLITDYNNPFPLVSNSSTLQQFYDIPDRVYDDMMINNLKPAYVPKASAPPVTVNCSCVSYMNKSNDVLFNPKIRSSLVPLPLNTEYELLKNKVPVTSYPPSNMLPQPLNNQFDYSNIRMPSMTRFITDAGKLAKLDELLVELKKNDHRVLIYFQMTKMMDLMEEYLTFKQHTYIRLDGSSKLDDRRDLVHDWQSKPEIFIFLLSTRAGGLGINLTAADTVIFYDSDWNPTIDSQAMDRAHRLGQTRQVTVYRLLARGTIEERMRDRAKQKEQVQQVVMEGKGMINNKKEDAVSKKKDVAFLLLGGDDADKPLDTSVASTPGPEGEPKKTKGLNTKKLEEMYHEGEGKFSGTVTPSNG